MGNIEKKEKAESFDEAKTEGVLTDELFGKLENVIGQLEQSDISLEEAFSLYKSGMDMVKTLNDRIQTVEGKILLLNEEGGLDEF